VKPAEIYLIIGANDVTKQTSPDAFTESYRSLLATLTETGAKVVVVTIPKLSATPAVPEAQKAAADARTKLLNEKITFAAKEYPNSVRLVDGYAFSEGELQPGSDFLADDQFHPNDAGYAKFAAEIVK
jgi:lysophospholipase L1-like esterase